MRSVRPESELRRFIARFTPEVAALGREAIARMCKRLPAATALVYDNYNATGVGFSSTERPGDIVFSIVLYPRRVSLFFMQAVKSKLDDPEKLLQGSGNAVRFIPLESAAMIDSAPVRKLMDQAAVRAKVPMSRTGKGKLVIQSISAKQRPRRPSGA
jgi:hypothetical protein